MGMFTPITWSRTPARWLMFTAILELALGAGFLVADLVFDVSGGGLLLTGAILGATGLGLFVWARKWQRAAAEAERIKSQGVAGSATIMSMRQTGVYLNEQPQVELRLQVQTQMHGPYEATVKEYVPLMLLGVLSSGRPLPVKVDPANPQRVIIEWESAGSMPAAGMQMPGAPLVRQQAAVQAPQGDPSEVKKRLLETGVAGTAKVISSAPTGQTDSEGRPMYSMMLEIQVEGHPAMQGPAVVGVPPERTDQLEAGDTVPIKADPNNPSVMAVDWENA